MYTLYFLTPLCYYLRELKVKSVVVVFVKQCIISIFRILEFLSLYLSLGWEPALSKCYFSITIIVWGPIISRIKMLNPWREKQFSAEYRMFFFFSLLYDNPKSTIYYNFNRIRWSKKNNCFYFWINKSVFKIIKISFLIFFSDIILKFKMYFSFFVFFFIKSSWDVVVFRMHKALSDLNLDNQNFRNIMYI